MNFLSFLCALIFVYKNSKVDANNSFYTAGVVEFRPTMSGMNSSESLADHLKSYLSVLQSAEATDTDIIVFPEGTLNNQFHLTYVPAEKDKTIPCLTNDDNRYADFFVQLSCAARRVGKYLVINLTEKENCPSYVDDPRPCATNNLNIFNTNVVFDREGRVVSRYRKVHVYVENKNTTYKPEFAVFDTDFGVRFGHFICFDILFYTPAQELVDRFGITDLIFTTLFYSELPFLTAVQLQHGWAWGNNVNLLAAGASYPQKGMTGSGIFSGVLGDLVSVMATVDGIRKLYKAKVPKKGSKFVPETEKQSAKQVQDVTRLRILKDPQIENYNSVLLDIKSSEIHTHFVKRLCHGDVCCSFEINAKVANYSQKFDFKYRVGTFDGRRTYEKEEWSDIKVCALYACANEEPSSCGKAVSTKNILFKRIFIKGSFPKGNKVLIMPSVLDDQLYPLKHNVISWSKRQREQLYEVELTLSQEHTNIMTFGIYGQYYEKSSTASASSESVFTIVPILLSLVGIVRFTG